MGLHEKYSSARKVEIMIMAWKFKWCL